MGLARFINRRFGALARPWKIEFDDTCTEEDVYNCFRLILGRNPSEIEWDGHKMHIGNKLEDVVASYISSLEFKRRRLSALDLTEHTLVDLKGYKMYVSASDTAVGTHIYQSKSYEPHVAEAMKAMLKPGMCLVDIGANIGYFSMLAAYIVGHTGEVIAFEPFQYNVKLLHHSADVNGFFHIEIFPFAVADTNGLLLYNNEASNGKVEAVSDIDMSLSSDLVYAVKLDDFLQVDRLNVIKIDVEGAEYMALKGAQNLLRKHRPTIFSEFSPPALKATSNVSAEDYLEILLVDDDYIISVIDEHKGMIACQNNIARVIQLFEEAKTDHIDVVAHPVERRV